MRGRDVFLVQGTAFPANDNFMELVFWIDALKCASASSVTAVIPYFGYAKGDKKDEPRVSIRARVCADAIEAAGVDRVVTLDLHASQVQGFFKVPVDDLYAMPVLCEAVAAKIASEVVVVAPDVGWAKKARQWSDRLGAPLAIVDERRTDHSESAEAVELIGSVEGRAALIVDDFTNSAGTLIDAARLLGRRASGCRGGRAWRASDSKLWPAGWGFCWVRFLADMPLEERLGSWAGVWRAVRLGWAARGR